MNGAIKVFSIVILSLSLISGCATTVINPNHHLYVNSADEPYANIYFIRKHTQRTRGVADNALEIELDEKKVLDLDKGEYALIKIKPIETDVIIRSETYITGQPMPIKVWRARHFNFEANKTYFIVPQFQQQEWRGIYFIPQAINIDEAKALASILKPAGLLAEKEPLESL